MLRAASLLGRPCLSTRRLPSTRVLGHSRFSHSLHSSFCSLIFFSLPSMLVGILIATWSDLLSPSPRLHHGARRRRASAPWDTAEGQGEGREEGALKGMAPRPVRELATQNLQFPSLLQKNYVLLSCFTTPCMTFSLPLPFPPFTLLISAVPFLFLPPPTELLLGD